MTLLEVRINFHDEDRSVLVDQPIKAFYESQDWTSLSLAIFPGWKFGPHVSVVIWGDDARAVYERAELAEAQFYAWLSEHTSETVLDEKDYEALSYKVGMRELEPPPYLPLAQNNTVSIGEYRRPASTKLDVIAENMERFLFESLDIVYPLIDLRKERKDPQLVYSLVTMMALIAERFEPDGIGRGFNTFRAHAEFFFSEFDREGKIRARFDNTYQALKSDIDHAVQLIIDKNHDVLFSLPVIGERSRIWYGILNKVFTRSENLVEAHYDFMANESVHENMANDMYAQAPKDLVKEVENKNEIVDILMNSEEGKALLASKEFMQYRLVVNCFYKLLPIIGLSPMQKVCMCNAVAKSVESLLDVSWQKLMIGEGA